MLVLTRKRGEKIILTTPQGEEVAIQVRRIDHGVVSLGIDAPQSVKITREELVERAKEETT